MKLQGLIDDDTECGANPSAAGGGHCANQPRRPDSRAPAANVDIQIADLTAAAAAEAEAKSMPAQACTQISKTCENTVANPQRGSEIYSLYWTCLNPPEYMGILTLYGTKKKH
jgi:hypothetical protein